MVEPEVVFNMDLANGPTTERFCWAAADVLGFDLSQAAAPAMPTGDEWDSEIADEWTSRLEDAGYGVWWDAGDVAVWDLRPLSDEERERFWDELVGA